MACLHHKQNERLVAKALRETAKHDTTERTKGEVNPTTVSVFICTEGHVLSIDG